MIHFKKVCIVGAGPSGVHMAMSLKDKGYGKVVVFEKSNRVGGKSYDIPFNGASLPLGTVFGEPNYRNPGNFIPLANKYGLGETIPLIANGEWRWVPGTANFTKLGPEELLISVAKLANVNTSQAQIAFVKTLKKYSEIHNEMFGGYEGYLMPQPDLQTMGRCRGTYKDFLVREGLTPMIPLLRRSNELQGYGYLDEVSALYGLMWQNPKWMASVALIYLGDDDIKYKSFITKNGYESLWEKIVRVENLDVKFKTDIVSIRRRLSPSQSFRLITQKNLERRSEACDFLIWTPEMKILVNALKNPSSMERRYFKKLNPEIFTSNLVSIKNEIRNRPYSIHSTSLSEKIPGGVVGALDMKGARIPNISMPAVLDKYNNVTNERTLQYILQLNRADALPTNKELNKQVC